MNRKIVWRVLLTALSAFSLAVHVSSPAVSPVLPDGCVWTLLLLALWVLYGAFFRLNNPFKSVRLWVLSAVFAGVMTLGTSFAAFGTSEWLTTQTKAAGLYFIGRVPLYFAGMRLLLHALSVPSKAKPVKTLHLSLALLVCWLPWFVCLFPGTVSNDSISQLKILLGLAQWSNANPVSQTVLVGLFRNIGLLFQSADAGVALYCIVQAGLMAWLLGSLLSEMSRSSAPRWLMLFSFLFYAFCPLFPVFAFCVGKDTNFAMAVLFLALECWRVTKDKGSIVRLCIASIACVLLRNPGIYLVIVTLAFLLIHTFRRKNWLAPLCALGSAGAVFLALHLLIIPALDIAPMPQTEEYSIPLQQVARVAASGSFTSEQAEAINAVIPLDQLKDAYNPELSDPVKDLWRAEATDEQTAAFFKVWPSIIADHPMTCASATFHNTYAYLYPGYVSMIKPTLLIGDQRTRTADVSEYYDYSINPLSARLKAFTQALNRSLLYRVLVSPGLYGWLTLLCAVWLWRRDKRALLCAVPALFTLAGCMLSAVNGYFRYAMPLYLSAPFLLWLMTKASGGNNEENHCRD